MGLKLKFQGLSALCTKTSSAFPYPHMGEAVAQEIEQLLQSACQTITGQDTEP